jgi:hypothetical protein
MITDKWKLIAFCVKAVTGIVGTSLIMTEDHPYITIIVLSTGAIANEVINHFKFK